MFASISGLFPDTCALLIAGRDRRRDSSYKHHGQTEERVNGTAPYSVKSGRVARFDEIEHQRAVDKLRNGHYKSAESQRKGNGRQLLHQGLVIRGAAPQFFSERKRLFFFPRVEKINNGENSQSYSLRQGYGKNSASHRLFYVGHEKIREVKPRSKLYYLFANLRQRGGRHVHFTLKISLERAYKTHKQYGRAYQSVKNSQIDVALNFWQSGLLPTRA